MKQNHLEKDNILIILRNLEKIGQCQQRLNGHPHKNQLDVVTIAIGYSTHRKSMTFSDFE